MENKTDNKDNRIYHAWVGSFPVCEVLGKLLPVPQHTTIEAKYKVPALVTINEIDAFRELEAAHRNPRPVTFQIAENSPQKQQ